MKFAGRSWQGKTSKCCLILPQKADAQWDLLQRKPTKFDRIESTKGPQQIPCPYNAANQWAPLYLHMQILIHMYSTKLIQGATNLLRHKLSIFEFLNYVAMNQLYNFRTADTLNKENGLLHEISLLSVYQEFKKCSYEFFGCKWDMKKYLIDKLFQVEDDVCVKTFKIMVMIFR